MGPMLINKIMYTNLIIITMLNIFNNFKCGWTPLVIASHCGFLDLIFLLLDHDADLHIYDNVIRIKIF